MISWKNFSPSSILLSHSEDWSGLALVPPKLRAVSYQTELTAYFSVLVFVDQLDGAALKRRRIWLRSLVCTLPPPLL